MNYLKTFLPYLFGNKKGKSLALPLPNPVPWDELNFEETLLFHTLKHSLNSYVHNLDLNTIKPKEIFHLINFLEFMNYEERLRVELHFPVEISLYKKATRAESLSKREVQELLDFKNHRLTLFALLHHDRTRPGLLLIRNPEGEFVAKKDGSIWSIPILGLSSRGLPFTHTNGCTPMGVFTIDSVMPEANKEYEYGKHRRLIVNFIEETKALLPYSQRESAWTKQAEVARVLGRSLLRIHGTGRINRNVFSPYYPMVPTSGCLATNEARIFGLKVIHDQRHLLDTLMNASGLEQSFENESKIHGLLYVIEFDDSLSTLKF